FLSAKGREAFKPPHRPYQVIVANRKANASSARSSGWLPAPILKAVGLSEIEWPDLPRHLDHDSLARDTQRHERLLHRRRPGVVLDADRDAVAGLIQIHHGHARHF